jgi:osmotically-inducible protein OsmY
MRRFMGMTLPAILVLLSLLVLGCRTNQLPETQAKDVQITAKIKGKLASEVRLATVTNVDVNTTNGVVTLSGTVSSPEEKEKVQTIAKSVEGVKSVNNNLQVAAAPSS